MAANGFSAEEMERKACSSMSKARDWHAHYRGKIQIALKCPITRPEDLGIWYTPGVAAPCKEIYENPARVCDYTNKANTVAAVSDGSRVLGLGRIGPQAALPVMEGKCLLFKYLGGVDAIPIVLDTEDPDEIVQAVKWIAPGFGGINLEDIANPKCFYILDRLRAELDIPVWHDDQQGTASVTLAAVINALKIVGKPLDEARIVQLGIGAAGTACVRVMIKAGIPAENFRVVDLVDGCPAVLTHDMDLEGLFPCRGEMLSQTNADRVHGSTAEGLRGADVLIAFTQPGPGMIESDWIRGMNPDAIVLVMANPTPEIWPWEAKAAGARIVGTGRSDFPNQVNNSISFPGIFRGTLDVCASAISDEMAIAAAYAIAETAEANGLNDDYIVPSMSQTEVFINEAVAVGRKAVEQGLARRPLGESELRVAAEEKILHAQAQTRILMESGQIPPPPEE